MLIMVFLIWEINTKRLLIGEFELKMVKDFETIKKYFSKLLDIANKIKLIGKKFLDSKLVEKIHGNNSTKI